MAFSKRFFFTWLTVLSLLVLSCSDKEEPTPQQPDEGRLVEATSVGSWPAANLRFLAQIAGMNIDVNLLAYDVEIFKVTYTTSYKDSEINASGLVLIPKTTNVFPMVSFHRGTIAEYADAPSTQPLDSEEVLSYSALTSTGFITVVPDLIGFGASKDIFHPYYVQEPTADAVVDMLVAARELADEKGIGFDERLFLAGYSQGGYVTMVAHKALEAEPVEGFNVVASFPGAGGYDLSAMLQHLRTAASYPDPYYIAFLGMSYQSYYDEESLIPSFFNAPYASKIPTLFNGINSGSDINKELTTSIPDLIREEVRTDSETHPANDFLEERFAENSPIDWVPVAPMYMYHGTADEVVPFVNSQLTYNRLINNGANAEKLVLIPFEGETHGSAVAPYIEDVIKKLHELK